METGRPDENLWRIELLGGLRARRGLREIERFPTQKIAALFAILAFKPGRRHPRERLVDMLWPEADLAAGRDRLSQALVWLRPQLESDGIRRGSILFADRVSVGISASGVTTDVADFEAALAVAEPREAAAEQVASGLARRTALEEAVAIYQGDLLPDVYSNWVPAERQRLLSAYLSALSRLGQAYEEAGDQTQALRHARRALAADALYEDAHVDLIRLLAAAGQTSGAIRQFHDLKDLLARELDSEPSAKTLALIKQIQPTTSPASASSPAVRIPAVRIPAVRIPAVRIPAFPRPLTRFFGREDEIARARRMVQTDGARLVTLLGSAGVGKTRLALAVAADLGGVFAGGAAFVPLADLREAAMIPLAVAEAFGLPAITDGSTGKQIADFLRDRPTLLILDNLEHLLPDAALSVRSLLEEAPSLTVLTTSRQRLGVDGEQELFVPSLLLPGPAATPKEIHESPSMQLFLDRARAVRPDFTLLPGNADAVAEICARLEGIPLAIELCAAWAQTLTPAQMLTQLAQRFDLLVSRRSDITPRHRTLRAALEYSYLMLPPDLQRLFARLSVFRGGWSLAAAEQVCAEESAGSSVWLVAGLTELRERSLVVAEENGESGSTAEMRFRFLDTLREFAEGQLTYADRTERCRAHLAWFLAQAESDAPGSKQEDWLNQMAREQENLRAALAWSLEVGDTEGGMRFGIALRRFWAVRGPLSEGCEWLNRLLTPAEAAVQGSLTVRADAWSALGQLSWARGDYPAAQAAHDQALMLRRRIGHGVAESLYHLGITAYRRDDYSTAQRYLEESLSLARAQDDRAGIARVLLNLGNIAYEQEDYARAEDFFQQSITLEEALGNRQRVANGFNNLALTAIAAQSYPKADALLSRALVIRRELTDHYGAATALVGLGATARLQGQRQRAQALLREGLTLAQEVGDRHITAIFLLEFGLLAYGERDAARAVPLLAASDRLFQKIGSSPGRGSAVEYREALAAARTALGETIFETLWGQGESAAPEVIASQLLER